MDNDQLIEFLKVTDGFSDIDVSKIICALQVIRKSRFNVSKLLRFILENTRDNKHNWKYDRDNKRHRRM